MSKKGFVLSLCDFSGVMVQPWIEAGYEAELVDIKHGQDVRDFFKLDRKVDAIFAFPPCTVFANSGARHIWYESPHRTRAHILEGLGIMDACMRIIAVHRPRIWMLENPVGKMRRYLGAPTMTFNPNEYAGYSGPEEAYTKRTLLWGKFNPPAKLPLNPVLGSKMHTKYGGRSERTKEMRSTTPLGFSRAFFLANGGGASSSEEAA